MNKYLQISESQTPPDDELFGLTLKGDMVAFNTLFRRYERKVYIYCMRVLMDEELAHDAFQEAFMRLYEHRHSYNGQKFMVWFFTIVRNVCLNMRRNKKTTVPFESSDADSSPAKESDFVLQERIVIALQSLPTAHREAIVLYEYEGYSYKQIADITESSVTSVKARIFRARKMLRTLLYPVVYDNER